ncbi:Putative thiosulfate sulfurtransferase, mitochondrial OS=Schizosaccharomyces pombe (strain 972 / ATCC 24843) GN=SPAC4H3,07c PE=3 SV=2 [Rhizoctonia solani AG-1 IB]|nr:Putative thiosulfate sulfurtransferase, mitochondrial OS=Schizosaccharomyces pombe (strain 972 / ATCC 24843) GN=SPAC4H3,07c PE=3 SV=2 [Rhizoctonia solani AG-1 IB]
MFRTIAIRATRSSLSPRVMLSAAPVLRPAVPLVQAQRFNSTRLNSAGPDWSAPVVTYEELKPRTEQPKEDAYLIDVRELDEIAQGSIPSSVPLPLSVFAEALRAPEDEFRNKHGFKKPTQNQEIIVYCRSGKRSATAADIAHKYGFTNIKNYSGSWLDWSKKEGENRG